MMRPVSPDPRSFAGRRPLSSLSTQWDGGLEGAERCLSLGTKERWALDSFGSVREISPGACPSTLSRKHPSS